MKLGSNSVLSIPSQIVIQRQRAMWPLIKFQPEVFNYRRLYDRSPLIYFVAELQYLYGFRISEVLSIDLSDISPSYKVTVKRLKREDPIVISLSFQATFIQSIDMADLFLFSTLTRHSVYYLYKELGIGFKSKYSSKLAVTHAFRHRLVAYWLNLGWSYEAIASELGHLSVRNSEFYGVER